MVFSAKTRYYCYCSITDKNMKTSILILMLLLFATAVAKAQQTADVKAICGNEFFLRDTLPAIEHIYPSGILDAMVRSPLVVLVVFHIVWKNNSENITDEIIFSQLEALNRDFNSENEVNLGIPSEFREFATTNIGIHFCLATLTPSGEPTNGIVRKQTTLSAIGLSDALFYDSLGGSTAWDTRYYLNIWVADTGRLISGFGTRPNLVDPRKDGVVIHPKYFGINNHTNYGLGRVGVHEIGHYFGLQHIWGSKGDCNSDDGLIDTPLQQYAYTGCPDYPQYSCETSNMFMNFMDYTDDPCMLMFTLQQKMLMLYTLTEKRGTLLTHQNTVCSTKTDNAFRIYPNPASDFLTIEFFSGSEVKLLNIQIIDISGDIILSDKVAMSSTSSINLFALPNGLYFLKIGSKINRFLVMR